MLNLEFQTFKLHTHFLKSILFYLKNFFYTYGYLFELRFALLTFGDKGVRVLAGPFLRSKILRYAQIFEVDSKFHFSQWKTYFSQFTDEFLKFEETEYLIHHVKSEM